MFLRSGYCKNFVVVFKEVFARPQAGRLSENSDYLLAPKLRFGSALANETPFHILFVAPVNFTPDASTLKRGLFEELQHWRRSSAASFTLGVIGELEIEDLE
jgi:hypothetical protein